MKKLLMSVALAALGVQVAFSQGQVNFNNTITTFGDGIDRYVYLDVVGGTKLVGTNYAAAVYWGTATQSQDQFAVRNLTETTLLRTLCLFRNPAGLGANPQTNVLAGTWASGGARTFIGADVGATVQLQVRVWDINRFGTYDLAKAAGAQGAYGQSDVFSFVIPAPTDPAGLRMVNLRAFALGVPEPSTIALGVLGLGSLLLFRRKKA